MVCGRDQYTHQYRLCITVEVMVSSTDSGGGISVEATYNGREQR